MTSQELESLMTQMQIPWSRIVKNMWSVEDPEGKYPRMVLTVEKSGKSGAELLKFITFICDVPQEVGPEFFVEFLRHNFRVDHGAFAMESKSEMSFVDTLEMENLDHNEFQATYLSMRDAPRMFMEKYDIDLFTMGKPQF